LLVHSLVSTVIVLIMVSVLSGAQGGISALSNNAPGTGVSEPCPTLMDDLRTLRQLAHSCLDPAATRGGGGGGAHSAFRNAHSLHSSSMRSGRNAPTSPFGSSYRAYEDARARAPHTSLQKDLLTVANVLSGVLFCTLDKDVAETTYNAAKACREVEEFVHELIERPEVVFELTSSTKTSSSVFVMTEEQETHSDLVERNIPRLKAFRHELSLLGIGRDRFWSAYFQLMRLSLSDMSTALEHYSRSHGAVVESPSECTANIHAGSDSEENNSDGTGTLHAPTWVMLNEELMRRHDDDVAQARAAAHNVTSPSTAMDGDVTDADADIEDAADGNRDDEDDEDDEDEDDGIRDALALDNDNGVEFACDADARAAGEKALEALSDPEPGYIAVSPYTAVHLRQPSDESSDWSVVDADDVAK